MRLIVQLISTTGLALMTPVSAWSLNWVPNQPRVTPGQVASKIAEFKEDDDVSNLAFSPDGSHLAVTTFTTVHIHIWQWQQAQITRTFWKPKGTAGYIDNEGVRYSPNGQLLAVTHGLSSRADGETVVTIFDTQTGIVVADLAEPGGGGAYTRIAFSPDGKSMIRTFDADDPADRNQLMVYDTSTWQIRWGLRVAPLTVMAVAIRPDGTQIAVGGKTLGRGIPHKAQIQVIDLGRREVAHVIDEAFPAENKVNRLAWSVDGRLLVASGDVGGSSSGPDAVRVFDTRNWNLIGQEPYPASTVRALAYSPDGKYLVEGGLGKVGEEKVRIWDAAHKTLLEEIPVHDSYAAAISQDSRYLALSDRRDVAIWKLN